jgi:hypothetical protein
MPVFTDTTLICRDCRKQFVFTAGEQESHDRKGFMNTPKRCPECRAARRSERERHDARLAADSAQGRPEPGGQTVFGPPRWSRRRR